MNDDDGPRSVGVHPETFAMVTLRRDDETGVPMATYGEFSDFSLPLTSGEIAATLRLLADALEERAAGT